MELLRQTGPNRSTTKRRRTTFIGEDGATGLVIHGTHDIDTEGTDLIPQPPPHLRYYTVQPRFSH
jgi:hypothetical protein